jgi:hypothetical protein
VLTPRAILERVAASILTALATPHIAGPWSQSRVGYDQFASRDSGEIEHHSFALAVLSTEAQGERRPVGPGCFAITELGVRWAHRLRAEAVAFDTAEAHDAEIELVAAIQATAKNPDLQPQFLTASRSTTRDGLVLLGELRWSVPHRYPLS